MAVRVFHRDGPVVALPMIAADARLIVWPGTGAHTASMNFVRLEPGEENQPHSHASSEDTIYIVSGSGTVDDLTNGTSTPFRAGQAIHIPAGVRHAVKADRGVEIVSVGGPCPPDLEMLRRCGVDV